MSTSDKAKMVRSGNMLKTVIVYLGVSAFCVLFDRIYYLFGHGVFSAAMTFMFLYPLFGGVIAFLLLHLIVPSAQHIRHYRLSYNLYNSGLAALTVSSALKGVFDIAGTSSSYLIAFNSVGILLTSFGTGLFIYYVIRK